MDKISGNGGKGSGKDAKGRGRKRSKSVGAGGHGAKQHKDETKALLESLMNGTLPAHTIPLATGGMRSPQKISAPSRNSSTHTAPRREHSSHQFAAMPQPPSFHSSKSVPNMQPVAASRSVPATAATARATSAVPIPVNYAGPSFHNSPDARSLPIPVFERGDGASASMRSPTLARSHGGGGGGSGSGDAAMLAPAPGSPSASASTTAPAAAPRRPGTHSHTSSSSSAKVSYSLPTSPVQYPPPAPFELAQAARKGTEQQQQQPSQTTNQPPPPPPGLGISNLHHISQTLKTMLRISGDDGDELSD